VVAAAARAVAAGQLRLRPRHVFQGIGASGFVTGSIKTVAPPASGGLSLRYAAFMQGLRDAIDARIRTTLDGDKRAIATALC
jgi:competence protein ComEC